MAIPAEHVDEAKAEEARERAAARLREKISDEEVATVNASMARSLAQLQVKGGVMVGCDITCLDTVRLTGVFEVQDSFLLVVFGTRGILAALLFLAVGFGVGWLLVRK